MEAAQTEAASILENAKAEAERIIADARSQADKILVNAKTENDRMVKSGEDAIRQAGRNLLISFRESVTRELEMLLNQNVTAVYSSEKLSQIIVNVVQSWAAKPDTEELTVILNAESLKALEETTLAGIKEKLLTGLTLKANDSFDGGFRIGVNGSSAYYDYSTEAVVDMLSKYLSPQITRILKEAE